MQSRTPLLRPPALLDKVMQGFAQFPVADVAVISCPWVAKLKASWISKPSRMVLVTAHKLEAVSGNLAFAAARTLAECRFRPRRCQNKQIKQTNQPVQTTQRPGTAQAFRQFRSVRDQSSTTA